MSYFTSCGPQRCRADWRNNGRTNQTSCTHTQSGRTLGCWFISIGWDISGWKKTKQSMGVRREGERQWGNKNKEMMAGRRYIRRRAPHDETCRVNWNVNDIGEGDGNPWCRRRRRDKRLEWFPQLPGRLSSNKSDNPDEWRLDGNKYGEGGVRARCKYLDESRSLSFFRFSQ